MAGSKPTFHTKLECVWTDSSISQHLDDDDDLLCYWVAYTLHRLFISKKPGSSMDRSGAGDGESKSGNRESMMESWSGRWGLGSGYSGVLLSSSTGGGSASTGSGWAGWRVPRLASRRWIARELEMTKPSFWMAYSLGVGAVCEWP